MIRQVGEFYDAHPYPPPRDDVEAYRRAWDDRRRRADSHLFWPSKPYRDELSILVAGCGTVQAVHYAVRWPSASVVGIDVSESSLAFARDLKRKHAVENVELRLLPVEGATELAQTFDYVVCTGVLHHLLDPGAGLRALREVLAPTGAMHVMVYAPYGRAGVYMLQEYCRRLGIGWSGHDIDELAATLRALPPDHPIVPLLRRSPDFTDKAGVADALLHPQDRAYSVPQLLEFIAGAGLRFGRWVRQAPYLPQCGAMASSPHRPRLDRLEPEDQYAAMELFRGTMARHSLIAYRSDAAQRSVVDFSGDAWQRYVPIRLPRTIEVRDRLPAGASAVLVNQNHTYADLYLPIDERQERLLAKVDGERTIFEISQPDEDPDFARTFFEQLSQWDQIVLDTSRA